MDKALMTDLIGWFATAVLVYTIGRQVWAQWRTRSTAGVSRWLFVGQLIASTAFVVYSFLVDNWVFVVSNLVMLVLAIVGQCIFLWNRRRTGAASGGAAAIGASAAATAAAAPGGAATTVAATQAPVEGALTGGARAG